MSRVLVVGIVVGLIAYAVTRSPAASYMDHPELEQSGVREAATTLSRVVKNDAATSMSLDELMRISDTAARALGGNHFAARTLRNAIRDARTAENEANPAEELLAGMKRVHETLTFRPLKEPMADAVNNTYGG